MRDLLQLSTSKSLSRSINFFMFLSTLRAQHIIISMYMNEEDKITKERIMRKQIIYEQKKRIIIFVPQITGGEYGNDNAMMSMEVFKKIMRWQQWKEVLFYSLIHDF